MIPLRDSTPSRSVPVITWLIVAANTAVFLFQLMMDNAQLEWFISNFAFIPASWQTYQFWFVVSLLTSMFMHGGWLHFISNMWILIIFGDNVEDSMGPVKYLVFYLLGGLAAGLMQFEIAPFSTIPTLGASGAIAGVMVAYVLLFPQARIDTLIPLIIFFRRVNVPAWVYLGFWFVTQLFSGVMALGQVAVGGVAWWAHIGGFAFGALGYRFFTRSRPKPEYEYPSYYR